MRIIDAGPLRAEYQAILDRGDMFCEYDIIGMLDNAPAVSAYTFKEVEEIRQAAIEQTRISCKHELLRTRCEFTIDELEKWLYRIAFNNTDNDFGKYCEEIIGRLDGFKTFVADTRKGGIQFGNCDYCKHHNIDSTEYPCNVCGNREPYYREMWEKA